MAHGGPHALGVGVIELLADRAQLTRLGLTDGEAAPPVGRADDGGVHQLQHRPLPEGMDAAPLAQRLANASYSCHSRSVTWLTAVRCGAVLVLAAAQRFGNLGLQCFLDDLPDGELDSTGCLLLPAPTGDLGLGCQARVHPRRVFQRV